MIVIGPALNTGIGQLCKKYTHLFGIESVYYVFGKELPQCDNGLIFMLPIPAHLEYLKHAKEAGFAVDEMIINNGKFPDRS